MFLCASDRKFKLSLFDGSVNSAKYIEVLEDVLVPAIRELRRNRATRPLYLHDNARIHTSHLSTNWFQRQRIQLLHIPAYSPDLNPSENVLSQLCREVYKNGRQYQCINDLKRGLQASWNMLPIETIESDVASMPNRMRAIITAQGGPIDY